MNIASENIAAMRQFVQDNGGRVRFDVFAREHLAGKGRGFYSDVIDLSNAHGPVPTPMHDCAPYRSAYAMLVLQAAIGSARQSGKDQMHIVELGPGGGEFGRELNQTYSLARNHFDARGIQLPELAYTAVDPNRRHIEALEAKGFHGVVGMAQSIPLEPKTADFIVAEEVLDSLPHRVFEVRRGLLTREAFVELQGPSKDRLGLVWHSAESSEELELVKAHLSSRPPPKAGSRNLPTFYQFSDDYLPVWQEMYRILVPGGQVFVSDYTIDSPGSDGQIGHERAAVAEPYSRDLTHFIDAQIQAAMAEAAGLRGVRAFSVHETSVLFAENCDEKQQQQQVMCTIISGARRLILAARPGEESDTASPNTGKMQELAARAAALAGGNNGGRAALQSIARHPQLEPILTILEQQGLSGGQLWALYSDKARENPTTFANLILSNDTSAFDYARRY